MSRHERVQLADELGVRADSQVGVDPVLEACLAKLVEPPTLDHRKRLVELGECGTAPERERPLEALRAVLGGATGERRAAFLKLPLEVNEVERLGRDRERVARRAGEEHAGGQKLAEPG